MSDNNNPKTEAEAASSLAAAFQQTREFNGVPAVLLPSGYSVHLLEKTLHAPVRKQGTTTLYDAEGFIRVTNDQKNAGTRLFSTLNPPSFTAVFNATAEVAGWGDHRAAYTPPLSAEWIEWDRMDEVQSTQVKMAQFLENNLEDIVSPDGATLLEICRTLQAKKSVDFVSVINLNNGGQQFTYNEDVRGSAVAGTVTIPETFQIAIPVFENGEKWAIDARLRFTIDGGKLTIWYEMVRAAKTLEAAVKKMRTAITEQTGLQILNGVAPGPR